MRACISATSTAESPVESMKVVPLRSRTNVVAEFCLSSESSLVERRDRRDVELSRDGDPHDRVLLGDRDRQCRPRT